MLAITGFCGDRTRIKSLLRRLKNIGMVSQKLYKEDFPSKGHDKEMT